MPTGSDTFFCIDAAFNFKIYYIVYMLKNSISLLMSVLLFSSPLNYSFNLHYCGDRLVIIDSIFENHKGCGMESESILTPPCLQQFHSDCCTDVFLGTIKYPDHLKKTVQSVEHYHSGLAVSHFLEVLQNFNIDSIYLTHLARPPTSAKKIYLTCQQWIFYG